MGRRGRALDAPSGSGWVSGRLPGPPSRAEDAPRPMARGRAGSASGLRGAPAVRPERQPGIRPPRDRGDPASDGRPGGRGPRSRACVRARRRRAARSCTPPSGARRARGCLALDRAVAGCDNDRRGSCGSGDAGTSPAGGDRHRPRPRRPGRCAQRRRRARVDRGGVQATAVRGRRPDGEGRAAPGRGPALGGVPDSGSIVAALDGQRPALRERASSTSVRRGDRRRGRSGDSPEGPQGGSCRLRAPWRDARPAASGCAARARRRGPRPQPRESPGRSCSPTSSPRRT